MRKASRVAKAKKKTAATAGRATSNKAMENAISKLYDVSVMHEIASGLDIHKETTVATIVGLDYEEVLERARMRQNYVEERARHKNRSERALVKDGFNVSQIVTDVFGKTGMVIVNGLLAGDYPKVYPGPKTFAAPLHLPPPSACEV
jgi:hypothetical protein